VVTLSLGKHAHRVVARHGHPLAHRPVHTSDLAKADWLLPASGVSVRKQLEDYFINNGFDSLNVVVVVDASAAWFTSMLKSTNLVTLMTDQMIRSGHADGLVVVDFPPISLSNSVTLIHRKNAYLS